VKGERRGVGCGCAWKRLTSRILTACSEINHFLHEKHMRLTNVHREAGGYVIEAAEEITCHPHAQSRSSGRSDTALKAG